MISSWAPSMTVRRCSWINSFAASPSTATTSPLMAMGFPSASRSTKTATSVPPSLITPRRYPSSSSIVTSGSSELGTSGTLSLTSGTLSLASEPLSLPLSMMTMLSFSLSTGGVLSLSLPLPLVGGGSMTSPSALIKKGPTPPSRPSPVPIKR